MLGPARRMTTGHATVAGAAVDEELDAKKQEILGI